MKKVLKVLLILIILGGLGTGGFFGYKYYKTTQQTIADYEAQVAEDSSEIMRLNARLSEVDATTTVYTLNLPHKETYTITDLDLVETSMPTSECSDVTITDKADLIGKRLRIDTYPGTILTKDLLMDITEVSNAVFEQAYTFDALPIDLKPGDYIDIRFLMPNGEECVVLPHKYIKQRIDNTLIMDITNEENQLTISMYHDLGTYSGYCLAYCTKYLHPGDDESIAMYPVLAELEDYVKFNGDILDTTRCINSTYRAHIDEVMAIFTDSKNASVASAFINQMTGQLSALSQAQQTKDTALEPEVFYPSGEGNAPEKSGNSLNESIDGLNDALGELSDLVEGESEIE